jgi:hypothetical protein
LGIPLRTHADSALLLMFIGDTSYLFGQQIHVVKTPLMVSLVPAEQSEQLTIQRQLVEINSTSFVSVHASYKILANTFTVKYSDEDSQEDPYLVIFCFVIVSFGILEGIFT